MFKALFFDMDGTITCPHIDWKELRDRIDIPEGAQIIAYIDSLPMHERKWAHAILETAEQEAARHASLNPGAAELFENLRPRSLKLALITNNNRRAMNAVVEKFNLHFDLLLSREDALLKPAPDLILLALEKLGLAPREACFIGDHLYDRMASQEAGVAFIHLSHDPLEPVNGPTIHSLSELLPHLGL